MSNRHRAEVIEVLDGGAAVKFSSGRIEFILRRGMVSNLEVGMKGTVDFVRSVNGYEWTFVPNKRQYTTSVSGENYLLHLIGANGKTFCGRQTDSVNCYSSGTDRDSVYTQEQCCRLCARKNNRPGRGFKAGEQ
jgi:hypothetical protein